LFSDVLYTIARLDWSSIVDILLVALIFYWLLSLVQGTIAVQLLRGVLVLVVIAVTVTSFVELTAFGWLINNSLPALLVAIPVIFQPELRRALERLGRTGGIFAWASQQQALESTLNTVAASAQRIALDGYGALIVLERETGLGDYIETGIYLDALVTEDLLATIFYHHSPLHDGAVIIRQDRVVAAGCLLPLSQAEVLHGQNLGTRHRASLGLTEMTDAIALIVSEETGTISVAYDGQMIRNLDQSRLLKILNAFYQSQLASTSSPLSDLRQKLLWRKNIPK